ncbi:MAG: hypothetical protein EOO46_24270 [Flavobacterium sp.]|nr:MAG: hypothetical protein EOO46_24270 [Flavobacterium sp.]
MLAEKYPVIASEDHTAFDFLSEGPKGTIRKIVRYQKITASIFNLAFGDWDDEKQSLSDLTRSNNADMEKVLATVAFTVFAFMDHHPGATVIAQGATPARTRLYQMGIKANWKEISLLFSVKGLTDKGWSDFVSDQNYDAFLISVR